MTSLISFLPSHPMLKIVILKCICLLDIFSVEAMVNNPASISYIPKIISYVPKKSCKSIVLQNGRKKKTWY